MWLLVCLLLLTVEICLNGGFGCQMIFLNNSVTFDEVGRLNGVAGSLAALLR